jgi:hypothetical protein
MKSLKYLIAMAVLVLAITPSLAFGQHNTGTQGCCDLLDPYWTLVAAPPGVTLGNVYSTPIDGRGWVPPSPNSWWINPTGSQVSEPVGNYDYQMTFTLTSPTMLSGEFAADNSACLSLDGSPTGMCTVNGDHGFEQYTPFELGILGPGTHTLDAIVFNEGDITGLELEIGPEGTTPEPSSLLLMGTGVLGLIGVVRRKLVG